MDKLTDSERVASHWSWRKQKHLCRSKPTDEIFEVHLTLKRPRWPGGLFFLLMVFMILLLWQLHFECPLLVDGRWKIGLGDPKKWWNPRRWKKTKGSWELKQVSKTKDDTIPKTKIAHKKLPSEGKIISQPPFSMTMLNFRGVPVYLHSADLFSEKHQVSCLWGASSQPCDCQESVFNCFSGWNPNMKQNMVLNQETNGRCVSFGKSPVAIGIDIHWNIKEKQILKLQAWKRPKTFCKNTWSCSK